MPRSRGSSPRMRGTPKCHVTVNRRVGIIPAYAGNTSPLMRRSVGLRDHPRVCGEHTTMATWFMPAPGSSPRMRGTPADGVKDGQIYGIIPAYAGNTVYRADGRPAHRDHPRVCGEHHSTYRIVLLIRGSSPRMRGTLQACFDELDAFGIIPAYAGNTSRNCLRDTFRRDHPRVCGEHEKTWSFSSFVSGSSPRMRGTRTRGRNPPSCRGIIPAYAGNTYSLTKFIH